MSKGEKGGFRFPAASMFPVSRRTNSGFKLFPQRLRFPESVLRILDHD
jgi:hypothetical protein